MSLTTDVPTGSGDTQSLTITGGNGGHLYKQIPAVTDTLYVRYYVKYPTSGLIQHSGVWAGGYNPALSFPNPQAGVKPNGNDRFSAAAEQEDAAFAGTTRFDHYDYWMGMHPDASNTYWGNTLLNNSSVQATKGQWTCVEQMIKLNNPVSSSNGEHAIWLNGTKVSHLGAGFPTGTWSGGNFVQGSGSVFPGFQWRNDANLNINYLWLQNYAPQSPFGTVKYDNLVAAKTYVGCMGASTTPSPTPTPTPLPPPPPPPASGTPGTVGNLSASNATSSSVTLSFTEVDNGSGAPSKYEVRYAPGTINWGTATIVSSGTCTSPVAGSVIGSTKSCTVTNLSAGTQYQFQLIAYRGTLNVDAVFGGFSNVANATTAAVTAQPITGDINQDHIVNSIDYSILNSKWFTTDATSDLNHDGIVNAIDFSMLNANWFKTW
jgi:hypothetical protein